MSHPGPKTEDAKEIISSRKGKKEKQYIGHFRCLSFDFWLWYPQAFFFISLSNLIILFRFIQCSWSCKQHFVLENRLCLLFWTITEIVKPYGNLKKWLIYNDCFFSFPYVFSFIFCWQKVRFKQYYTYMIIKT